MSEAVTLARTAAGRSRSGPIGPIRRFFRDLGFDGQPRAHAHLATEDEVYHLAVASTDSGDGSLGRPETTVGASQTGDAQLGLDDTTAPKIARYTIVRRLGEGGMGVVYVAYDEKLDRKVALKLIKGESGPVDQARMLREGQAMARLSHPNVVPVFEVGEHRDSLFLAMEFVEGQTLRQWQRAEDRAWQETLAVYIQAARGLAAAHEAGMLHRDFKPDNALVGTDGRVRVLDFGLARAMAASEAEGSKSASSCDAGLSQTLTATGATVGTPAYMAPEQFLGNPVDARTDVFAWSVALFEALYGMRPYRGRSRIELLQAITSGSHVAPDPARGVPAWLQDAVLSGLHPDPERRPASMDTLLAVVDVDPGRARRFVQLGGAGVGVAGVAAALGFFARAEAPPCQGFEQRQSGVWNDRTRAEVRAAFEGSGSAMHATAWATVEPQLDRVADSLTSEMLDACEATRVRGEQSEAMLDKRVACLDERWRSVAALVDVFLAADAATVAMAEMSVSRLPEAALCSNATFLDAGLPPPVSAEAADEVAALRDELARASALQSTGHPRESSTVLDAVSSRIDSVDYDPLSTESNVLRGRVAMTLGAYAESRAALLTATDQAEAARHDLASAEAWTMLLHLAIEGLHNGEEAQAWRRRARAAIRRIGDPPKMVAQFAALAADLDIERGDFAAASKQMDALTDEPAYAEQFAVRRGRLALAEGDVDLAIEAFEAALDEARARSPEHPAVARAEQNLAGALLAAGRVDDARAHAQQAIERWSALFSGPHPELGRSYIVLGASALAVGDLQAASSAMQDALEAIEGSVGADHPVAAEALIALGVIAFMENDLEASERRNRRALELLDRAYAEDRPEIGNTAANLGETLLYLGRLDEARTQLQRASAVMEKTLGPEHPDRALPLKLLGLVHLLDDNPDMAVPPLRKSVELVSEGRPYERADTLAALAVALWPSDRAAAREVAAREGARLTDPAGVSRRAALIELLPNHLEAFTALQLTGTRQ